MLMIKINDEHNVTDFTFLIFFYRTTGSGNPGSKSPAGGTSGEPRTPVAGPQNKQLQNVKGDHPSVCNNFSPPKKLCIDSTFTTLEIYQHLLTTF